MKRLTEKQLTALFENVTPRTNINRIISDVCGELISDLGSYRDVYELKADPEHYVVKVERDMEAHNWCNVCEFRNWVNYRMTPLGKLLCPAPLITTTGQVLIMRRATVGLPLKDYPERLPACFTDTKSINYGLLEGRIVCVDYAFLIAEQVATKKVKWRKY